MSILIQHSYARSTGYFPKVLSFLCKIPFFISPICSGTQSICLTRTGEVSNWLQLNFEMHFFTERGLWI